MAQKLFESLAARLERKLADDPAWSPPSIHELAAQNSVSVMTMWKAVHVLIDKGALQAFKGKKLARPGASVAPAGAPHASDLRIFALIKEKIVDGSFRTGEALPKLDVFVLQEHVTRHAIVRALNDLSRENLVHKAGKRWIVGPAGGMATAARAAQASPAALLVMTGDEDFQRLFLNNYLSPFVNAFYHEIDKAGMRLRIALRFKPSIDAYPAPWGIDGVRAEIERLGPNYRGAVIIDDYLEGNELGLWVDGLSCGGEKPVINFDASGIGAERTRRELGGNRRYYRMFFDEPAAVRLALRELAGAGHARIGFPTFGPDGAFWTVRRYQSALIEARQFSPAPRIITETHSEPFFTFASLQDSTAISDFSKYLNSQLERHQAKNRSRQQAFMAMTPSLTALLKDDITALLCLNDWLADKYWLWFRMTGIGIPRHLSMLSFDNHPQARIFPVSSIDFGFPRLGYLTAHILIRDVPISADADGNIAGMCSVVDRGSIGKPAEKWKIRRIVRG